MGFYSQIGEKKCKKTREIFEENAMGRHANKLKCLNKENTVTKRACNFCSFDTISIILLYFYFV